MKLNQVENLNQFTKHILSEIDNENEKLNKISAETAYNKAYKHAISQKQTA